MSQRVGEVVTHASSVLLPARRFDEYFEAMGSVFEENIHYIDPVHEMRGRETVLKMLRRYVPRVANEKFVFELVHEASDKCIWKWRISLKILFFQFVIHGLVEALVRDGKIYYQREYYDPMESIGVIPVVGFLYKLILRTA